MIRLLSIPRVLGVAILLLTGAPLPAATPGEGNYGFKRPINPAWFPDDPRQWSQFDRSLFVTDLSQVQESGALVTGQREKGKWKVIPYEVGKLKGNALSAYFSTEPPQVSIKLKAQGWHAVYLGLSTVSGGINKAQQSGVIAKLGKSESFRRMHNNMRLTSTRGDVVQEQLVASADAAFDEAAGRLVVKLEAFLRPADLLVKERRFRARWLPENETVTESVAREECHDVAREIFHRWVRKLREAAPQLHHV